MFLCPAVDKKYIFCANLAKKIHNYLLKLKFRIETNSSNSNIGQIWYKKSNLSDFGKKKSNLSD